MPGRTQHFYFKGANWSLLKREFDALVGYIERHGVVRNRVTREAGLAPPG